MLIMSMIARCMYDDRLMIAHCLCNDMQLHICTCPSSPCHVLLGTRTSVSHATMTVASTTTMMTPGMMILTLSVRLSVGCLWNLCTAAAALAGDLKAMRTVTPASADTGRMALARAMGLHLEDGADVVQHRAAHEVAHLDNVAGADDEDDIFVHRPCRASSCYPHRGAAWLLLCGRTARQCGWAFEEAATHLRQVVGAPPTWLEPCPPSFIVVVVAVVRTAWPIGQSRRRQRRQSSLSIGAVAALLMGADMHVRVVSACSGLDAAMYAPVLVVDPPPFSHLRRRPSRSSTSSSESCEPSSSS